MRRRWVALAFLVVVAAAACGGPEDEGSSDGTWVGTITTEGNVTTVVNESGSVWGGTARLVEEASIGVESGPDEYLFGNVTSVWATDDRTFVLDSQVPTLRVYDMAGSHLFDVGRAGEGPGEFGTMPLGVAVNGAGDMAVIEASTQLEVFSPDGTPKVTWNSGANSQTYANEMLILDSDESLWVLTRDRERGSGYAKIGPDGTTGEAVFSPRIEWQPGCLTYMSGGREDDYCNIPYSPTFTTARTPNGDWAIGTTDEYEFEIRRRDGSVLRISRYWDSVPVAPEEAAQRKHETTAYVLEDADDPSWTWNGPEIPDHKPAYKRLIPDRSGRVWVLREEASRRSIDCDAADSGCWTPEGYWFDAFGSDGRFLGSVRIDSHPRRGSFIDDDTIVIIVEDDAGTIMVKRYRLVLPGEEGR